jgi:hypothetical protein
MKASITNNSRALQGVHSVAGLVFIEPKATLSIDVADDYVERVKALPFLTVDDALDHDGDGKAGGATNSDREDLKAQAKELGIEHPRNIPTDKLKELIDAKLAS